MKTYLSKQDVLVADWPPGILSKDYMLDSTVNIARQIAIKEHVGSELRINPSLVKIDSTDESILNLPLNSFPLSITEENNQIVIDSNEVESLHWSIIDQEWRDKVNKESFALDLGISLIRQFVRRVIINRPHDFLAIKEKPVLYFANHQTSVESFLFMAIMSCLANTKIGAIARAEHRYSWMGLVTQLADIELRENNPLKMLYFDRSNQGEMINLLQKYTAEIKYDPYSLLVHVEGKLEQSAGHKLENMSSVLIDMAIANSIPIVPIRFSGGLPINKIDDFYDFPYLLGKQDYFIGEAIQPEILYNLPYVKRPQYVIDAINATGPIGEDDQPLVMNNDLNIKELKQKGLGDIQAVLYSALMNHSNKYNMEMLLSGNDTKEILLELFGGKEIKTEKR